MYRTFNSRTHCEELNRNAVSRGPSGWLSVLVKGVESRQVGMMAVSELIRMMERLKIESLTLGLFFVGCSMF